MGSQTALGSMKTIASGLSVSLLAMSLLTFAQDAKTAMGARADEERTDPSRFDKAVAGLKESERNLYLYERVERVEERKSASDPNPATVKIARVFPAGTGIAHIALGPDGKPTDAEAYKNDLEKLLGSLEWAATGGKQQREAYEKVAKKQKERADLIDQTRNAFIFTYLGEETREGRPLSKFHLAPNPSYKPTTRSASLFSKVTGTVWLDDASGQMARIEGEITDDISFGIFLGKIYKGSHFMQERYEFAPGVWLPSFSQYDFDARKLFSSVSVHQKTFSSDYRRVGTPAEAIPLVRAELDKLGVAPSAAAKP
ncbi:MAG: hypothetical protein JSS69_02165 [Acidobacteria bacterium]|nr:hypothetical protein [Acidobacteriota bacterium]MBS1864698.1 hypothetical protein [Acidobacteriota bacterium]